VPVGFDEPDPEVDPLVEVDLVSVDPLRSPKLEVLPDIDEPDVPEPPLRRPKLEVLPVIDEPDVPEPPVASEDEVPDVVDASEPLDCDAVPLELLDPVPLWEALEPLLVSGVPLPCDPPEPEPPPCAAATPAIASAPAATIAPIPFAMTMLLFRSDLHTEPGAAFRPLRYGLAPAKARCLAGPMTGSPPRMRAARLHGRGADDLTEQLVNQAT